MRVPRRRTVRNHGDGLRGRVRRDRKSTRLNSSHGYISYAVFCLKKKTAAARLAVVRAGAAQLADQGRGELPDELGSLEGPVDRLLHRREESRPGRRELRGRTVFV